MSADLVRITPVDARVFIDETWWSDVSVPQPHEQEGDEHWPWEKLVRHYGANLTFECLAILSEEKYLEGAVVFQVDAQSKLEVGKNSVYIERLATAPRNRTWLVERPLYKGIGTVLSYTAVRESYELGLGGRVALQSLPTPTTVRFYEGKGFIRTDLSQPETGLIDYELPSADAIEWLRREGDLS